MRFLQKEEKIKSDYVVKIISFLGVQLLKKEKSKQNKKVKLLGIPLFKTTKSLKGTQRFLRLYLFGIYIMKIMKSENVKKVKLFGIPVFSCNIKSGKKKYHLFGIKFLTKKVKNTEVFAERFVFDVTPPKKFNFAKENSPLVSIIIPVYNQYKYTLKCLYSIYISDDSTPYEIIIADDCSGDETKNITKFVGNITVARNNTNKGFIENCNNAAKYAKGKYIYFLNNDTIVQKKWLEELVNVFQIKNNVGAVGSQIIRPNGRLQECGVLIYSDGYKVIGGGENPLEFKYNYLRECDYVSGCSLLTPKKLFDEVGGFDTRFAPAYCDDSDYCIALKQKGLITYVQPKSRIVHLEGTTYSENKLKLQNRNNKLLHEKWKDYFSAKTTFDVAKDFSEKARKPMILIVDDFYPQFDKHAGGKTIFQFLQLFTRYNIDVKFCPLFSQSQEQPYFDILADMGIEVIPSQNIYEWIENKYMYIDYVLLSRPQVAERFMIKSMKNRGMKVFYYGHDLHHLRMQRENAMSGTYAESDIEYMKKIEESAISFCDFAFYPSIIEKKHIKDVLGLSNVEVISPYLYDTSKMPSHSNFDNSEGLIFVGSSHGPNLDGLKWFVNNILPKVVKKLPDIKLYVVGSSQNNEVKQMESNNIKVLGYLSQQELENLYSKVRISVAPLRYGAGIKGKIIDALYHSVPVVTTEIGVEGIENSQDLIKVANDENDFAQKIIDLYSNKKEWEKKIPLYKKFIANSYSFQSAEKIFKKYISLN